MSKIINGEAIKTLKEFNDINFSLLLTSPSYFNPNSYSNKETYILEKTKTKEEYVNKISEALLLLFDKNINKDFTAIIIIGTQDDSKVESIIYMLQNKLDKINIEYKLFGTDESEAILILSKTRTSVIIPDFQTIQNYGGNEIYGTLSKEIIKWGISTFTQEDETVIDCYAGAGGTVTEANKMNRKYIGIEINEFSFNLMKESLNE